ncbi:MAG: GvpL/GvpF family gas vesicle protein [Candidatus Viridilinea halotolerans]|uniref:GvpL/GvpF family gas vesicle protein n=1 Tax=Candidatus Viridilinea halotolerans TaxID=2491704 RepID=A0A426U4M4_9CHLR|nr:MAG: GvpL/GvpF family gas vesicle protein [Candidatus Viridilinea halotolerans]
MIYLYAITNQSQLPPNSTTGLLRQPLYFVVYEELRAVVSAIVPQEVQTSAEQVWAHEAVVETLMAHGAVLPVRFGTILEREAVVEALLRERAAVFRADLTRLAGCVELGLRALLLDLPAPPAPEPQANPSSGREYMLRRFAAAQTLQARRVQAITAANALHAALTDYAVASVQREPTGERMLLSAAYLVRHAEIARFREAVVALDAANDHLRLLCTGPWPPYHFVSRDEGCGMRDALAPISPT